SHREWLVEARKAYGPVSAGGENCYAMLRVAEKS
ncbi:hypothetical protein SAMN05518861_1401, partial [Mesorhizobium sp. YR577]